MGNPLPRAVASAAFVFLTGCPPSVDQTVGTTPIDTVDNVPPTAQPATVSGLEDTPLQVLLTAVDPERDPLSFTITASPAHGTLLGEPPDLVFTPDPEFYGEDSVSFTVNDGLSTSAIAVVTLRIAAVNDAPVAHAQVLTGSEDASIAITLTGSDVDGDELAYTVTDAPDNGVLTGVAPDLSFLPNPHWSGSDTLTFIVDDGALTSVPATVSIAVVGENDPPTADPQSLTMLEDFSASVEVTGSDPEGDPLTWAVDTAPLYGTVSGTGPSFAYTPDPDFNGPDEFTVTANDGQATSPPASIEILVIPVNDAPSADDIAVSTIEDVPVSIGLSGHDADGDALVYTLESQPTDGSLSGTPPDLIYTPDLNFVGTDLVTYRAIDSLVGSALATVSITVVGVNDPAVGVGADQETDEDQPVSFVLEGVDEDGDALAFVVVTEPMSGVLTGTPPDLTYTPDADFNGIDSLSFTVDDGTGPSAPAWVEIEVMPVNDAPVAEKVSVGTDEDTPVTISLVGLDIDGDDLTFQLVSFPEFGSVGGSPPNITYTPDPQFNGVDQFAVVAHDGTVPSAPAQITVLVTSVNDPPVQVTTVVETDEDVAVSFTLEATDADGDVVVYGLDTLPVNGSLVGTPPDLTYTPPANWHGTDALLFTASDGVLQTAPLEVTLVVYSVNDLPTADDLTISTMEDVPVMFTMSGTDEDADPLSFVVLDPPANGVVSGTGAARTFHPAVNFSGTDSFTYVADDGQADSLPATVTVFVNGTNDGPVAETQYLDVLEDVPTDITLTGTDPDGDLLLFEVASLPLHGALSGTAPDLNYTPDADYTGTDAFAFTVTDGIDTVAGTIFIDVLPVNDPPTASDGFSTTAEDESVAFTATALDPDGDTLVFEVAISPIHGTISGAGPDFIYTPDPDFSGTDSLTFLVTDAGLLTASGTWAFTVSPVNDAPTADDLEVFTIEDSPVDFTLSGADVEGDSLVYVIESNPVHGQLSGTGPNLIYTPDLNFSGVDSFSFVTNDSALNSNPATVTLEVQGVNDPPTATAVDIEVDEDASVVISLTGIDPEGDEMTAMITGSVGFGFVSSAGAEVTYTPIANYHGPDGFTFTVSDGVLTSDPGTVAITVLPVNDRPTAESYSVTIGEDTSVALVLGGDDIDGDELTFEVASPPANGELSGALPNLTYTPNPNYSGSDTFTYTSSDGGLTSAEATITVHVGATNDPPEASDLAVLTDEDVPVDITLTATDPDGDPLSYSLNGTAIEGVLSGIAPDLTYTPAPNWYGSESFSYTVADGVFEIVAWVTITVAAINDPPDVSDVTVITDEDVPVDFALAGTDVDGDPLTYLLIGGTSVGSIAGTAPNFKYTPHPNASGVDSFGFTVDDGTVTSAQHTVTVTVTSVNDVPLADEQHLESDVDAELAITLTATDADGDVLSFAVSDLPSNGTLSGTAPNLSYLPNSGFAGLDSFTFTASDPWGGTSVLTTISVNVLTGDDPPTPDDDAYSVEAHYRLSVAAPGVLENDSDPNGDALTIVSFDPISLYGGNVAMTADGGFTFDAGVRQKSLKDSFTYTVSDGSNESVGTVWVDIGDTVVWFVDAAGPVGDGRFASPHNTVLNADDGSATGDVIYLFSTSDEEVSRTVLVSHDRKLFGAGVDLVINGSVLVAASTAPVLSGNDLDYLLETNHNAHIAGVELKGGGIEINDDNYVQVWSVTIKTPQDHGFKLTNPNAVSIWSVEVHDATDDAVHIEGGSAVIEDSLFTGSGADCVWIDGVSIADIDGVHCDGFDAHGVQINGFTDLVSVTDSQFNDGAGDAIRVNLLDGVDGQVVIVGNVFGDVASVGRGVMLNQEVVRGGLEVSITSNTFADITAQGIELEATGSNYTDEGAHSLNATGNVFTGCGDKPIDLRSNANGTHWDVVLIGNAISLDDNAAYIQLRSGETGSMSVVAEANTITGPLDHGFKLKSEQESIFTAGLYNNLIDGSGGFLKAAVYIEPKGGSIMNVELDSNEISNTNGQPGVQVAEEPAYVGVTGLAMTDNEIGDGLVLPTFDESIQFEGTIGVGLTFSGEEGGNLEANGNQSFGGAPLWTIDGTVVIVDQGAIPRP